jgi:O-antigen/teichoic acid export membrane protein
MSGLTDMSPPDNRIVNRPPSSDSEEATDAITQPRGLNGLGSGVFWSYCLLAVTACYSLFVAGFVLRRFGARGFGTIAIVMTATGYATVIEGALSTIVARAAARERATRGIDQAVCAAEREEVATAHAIYATFAIAIFCVSLVTLVAAAISHEGSLVVAGLAAAAAGMQVGSASLAGVGRGHRMFRAMTIWGLGGVVAGVLVLVTLDSWGLASVGASLLAHALVARGGLAFQVRRCSPWVPLRPRRPSWLAVRRVGLLASPLLIIGVGGQLITTTDLLVVGAVSSMSGVGWYRAGSSLPTQTSGILFGGYDVVFPWLAESDDRDHQIAISLVLMQTFSLVGVAGLALMATLARDVLFVLAGESNRLGVQVLVLFCAVWAVNIPIHGLALLLVARGEQRVLTELLVVELVGNVVLTVLFGLAFGPVGPAIATLLTIVVSNIVVLPLLVAKRVDRTLAELAWPSIAAALIGAVLGGASGLAAHGAGLTKMVAISAAGGATVVLALLATAVVVGPNGRALLHSGLPAGMVKCRL